MYAPHTLKEKSTPGENGKSTKEPVFVLEPANPPVEFQSSVELAVWLSFTPVGRAVALDGVVLKGHVYPPYEYVTGTNGKVYSKKMVQI